MTRTLTIVCDGCKSIITVDSHVDADGRMVGISIPHDHRRWWELCEQCSDKAERLLTKAFGEGILEKPNPLLSLFGIEAETQTVPSKKLPD